MKTPAELQTAVIKYQNGNMEAFNMIYEQSFRYLHTCVIHVVKNEDAAMDMLQETYLEISKNIAQLKSPEDFLSWAAMIANRKCFAYLKKQKNILLVSESTDEEGSAASDYFETIADDEAFIPETVLQDREKQRLLKEIIDGLSDIQRLCVIGFYYNEQKQDEIAEELGIKVDIEMNKRKVKKCFEYANKENIKYVIVVGSNEIESNSYTIKDMNEGKQYTMSEEELLEFLK